MYLDLSTKHTTKYFVALLTYLTGGLMPLTPIFKKMRLTVARSRTRPVPGKQGQKGGASQAF